MEQSNSSEVRIEMTPDQKLDRVQRVLGQLVEEDEFMTGQIDGRDRTPHDLMMIRFGRCVLEAALGNDSNPTVELGVEGGRSLAFDLSEDSGQARMIGENK